MNELGVTVYADLGDIQGSVRKGYAPCRVIQLSKISGNRRFLLLSSGNDVATLLGLVFESMNCRIQDNALSRLFPTRINADYWVFGLNDSCEAKIDKATTMRVVHSRAGEVDLSLRNDSGKSLELDGTHALNLWEAGKMRELAAYVETTRALL